MIRVRFFAALREKLGRESIEVDSKMHSDLCRVIEAIRAQLGEAAAEAVCASNIRVAVNREFIGRDVHLREVNVRDGDEVAFMPPITGG